METDNEKEEQQEKIYYNWSLAFLISVLFTFIKMLGAEPIEDISWWWVTLALWLPFPLSLIISLIRKFF